MPSSKLHQLQQFSTVVADTGDIQTIAKLKPIDVTTNPSLLLKTVALPANAQLIKQIRQRQLTAPVAAMHYAVAVGQQILPLIPGRISTEVDARLSFNTPATYTHARQIIDCYAAAEIPAERILIKIAATWEGIKAAEQLEKAGIQTNLTLLFSFAQAVACADAGVYLISPFVGRIYDWYKKERQQDYTGADDPGVQSVTRIYQYYKNFNYPTIIMGASFRNLNQLEQLAGCDRLTISPELIEQLASSFGTLQRKLSPTQTDMTKSQLDESNYRWQHNADAMAVSKLAEGLRIFAKDQINLEKLFS